jgi:AcrR family transcriptional regulator
MTEKSTLMGRRRSAANKDSRASYQARRTEICEAAVKVFNQQGFVGASLSKVAKEIGVDRASLYYYFSSKEQLFDEIVGAVLEKNHALARKIAESRMSPQRKMRELVTAMMTSYGETYPLMYIYIREDLRQVGEKRSEWSDRMKRLNKGIEQAFIQIIEQGQADESFRKIGSSKTIAYGILGMLNWTHRWYRPGAGETTEEIGKTFAEVVLMGLESPF